MDDYGIGAAALGAFETACRVQSGTGRTTRMLERYQEGDRIVFRTLKEAKYAQHLAKSHNKDIRYFVCSPENPDRLFDTGTPQGRTLFDHSWLEHYYRLSFQRTMREVRSLQDSTSGYGEPHRKAKLKAAETHEARRMVQMFDHMNEYIRDTE